MKVLGEADAAGARQGRAPEGVRVQCPGSSSSLLSSLELSDTHVYEPWIRALLGTAAHFCKVVVFNAQRCLFDLGQVCLRD